MMSDAKIYVYIPKTPSEPFPRPPSQWKQKMFLILASLQLTCNDKKCVRFGFASNQQHGFKCWFINLRYTDLFVLNWGLRFRRSLDVGKLWGYSCSTYRGRSKATNFVFLEFPSPTSQWVGRFIANCVFRWPALERAVPWRWQSLLPLEGTLRNHIFWTCQVQMPSPGNMVRKLEEISNIWGDGKSVSIQVSCDCFTHSISCKSCFNNAG